MSEKIIEKDSNKQFTEDYTRYGVYIMYRRVLSDYRDGLKPVQRRILWAMFNDCKAIGSNVKSASVVGRVIELYHPHGDCLHAQTPLFCLDGKRITISDAYNMGLQKLDILAVDQNTGNVIPAIATNFRIGQYTNMEYHIHLTNGAEVICTANHPFLMQNMEWVKAESIRQGMRLYSKHMAANYEGKLSINNLIPQELSIDYVAIKTVDNEPMYDFTVNGLSNMLIPVSNETGVNTPFICVHNSAVYETIKPLANWFETKVPLIQGKGNFGTFQGDPMAASRYTECRLSQFAVEAVLADVKGSKQSIDWSVNYSETAMEPEFLPCAVPLLLINGSFGIGLGIKAEIPSHNLREVIDATLMLIQDPNANITLIPDSCMPCEIFNTDFEDISNKGFGHFIERGIIDTGEFKGKPALFIRSTPDMVYLNGTKPDAPGITGKIEKLIADKKIIQIETSYDESTVDELKYVLVLKPGSDPEYVKNVIYKNTEMEKNIRINFETLDGLTPLRMSYKSYLLSWIEFRKMTKFRVYTNQLQDIQTKIHEKEAYIKVLESGEIEDIIARIRKQKSINDDNNIEYLIKRFNITDLQAKYIINANIKKLSLGYLAQYKAEAVEYTKQKEILMKKVMSDEAILQDIIAELNYFKQKYGQPRRAKIIKNTNAIENQIPNGAMSIVLTESGFLKKIPYGTQLFAMRNDSPKIIIHADNIENILVFDAMGKVFKLPVHKISFTDKNANGIDARFLIKGLSADVCTIMRENDLDFLSNKRKKNNFFICVLSHNGYIKRMDMEDFANISVSGLTYSRVEDGDYIKDICIISEKDKVIVYSDRKAIMMSAIDIPYLKRNTRGSKSLNGDLKADGMQKIDSNENINASILTVSQNGYINNVPLSTLPELISCGTKRKSVPTLIRLSKTDKIIAVLIANPNDKITIKTINSGNMVFNVCDIPVGSSVSAGTKIISTRSDKIISVSK